MQAPAGRGCQQLRLRRGWKRQPVCATIAPRRTAHREGLMTTGINRRQFQAALGWGAASITLAELGLARPARAEENFTVASTGASWGEGLRVAFIDAPKFEEKNSVK